MNLLRSIPIAVTLLVFVGGCSDRTAPPSDRPISITAQRGPVEATMTADHGELEVGESLTVTVEVVAEPGVEIVMPLLPTNVNASLGPFRVSRESLRPDIPIGGGDLRRVWKQVVTMDTFQSGSAQIPVLDISFIDRRGEATVEGKISVGPLDLQVTSLIQDEAVLRSIRGPVQMIDPWPWWAWTGLVILVVAAVLLLTTWFRGRGLEEVAPLSPGDQARRDLNALAASDVLSRGDIHPFYVRLTDILRHYLEGQFGLRAPQTTTPEFLVDMKHHEFLTPEQQRALDQFLRTADMVKFARHEPSVDTGRQALDQARAFVEETTEPESSSDRSRSAA